MKSLTRFVATLSMIAAAAVILSPPVYAAVISAAENPALFGDLNQNNTNCPLTNCGPTAAVNSFVFLQNMYPAIYSNPLVPTVNPRPIRPAQAEEAAAANTLGGAAYMGNCGCGNGTYIEDFILGKHDYIEAKDPGSTIYAAQMNFAWRPSPAGGNHLGIGKPGYVQDSTKPTEDFIASQIKAGEDVEAFIFGTNLNHYITLTDISFESTTGVGNLSFVDPAGGGHSPINAITVDGDGFIQFTYMGTSVEIVHVVAESPVPEPSTLLLLGTGLAGVAGYRLRRKRAAGA